MAERCIPLPAHIPNENFAVLGGLLGGVLLLAAYALVVWLAGYLTRSRAAAVTNARTARCAHLQHNSSHQGRHRQGHSTPWKERQAVTPHGRVSRGPHPALHPSAAEGWREGWGLPTPSPDERGLAPGGTAPREGIPPQPSIMPQQPWNQGKHVGHTYPEPQQHGGATVWRTSTAGGDVDMSDAFVNDATPPPSTPPPPSAMRHPQGPSKISSNGIGSPPFSSSPLRKACAAAAEAADDAARRGGSVDGVVDAKLPNAAEVRSSSVHRYTRGISIRAGGELGAQAPSADDVVPPPLPPR